MEKVANWSHLRQRVLWLVMIIELLLFLFACSAEIPARKILEDRDSNTHEVRLQISDKKVVIDNGLVEVTIQKPSGFLTGIKYKGLGNVLESRHHNDNKGYWDLNWDKNAIDKLAAEHVKVITQTDDLVELSCTKKWNYAKDHDRRVPLNIDKRFIVRRGVPGVYMYGIFEREEDFRDAHMYQLRIALKLKRDKFRFMAMSDIIQRIMPSEEDRDHSRCQIIAFKEAVLLTNPTDPQLRGEVDDKYQYSSESKDNKLHGWISEDEAVGFWVITPSYELRTGGPHKQDLTSHVGPTALSMFVSTHYTGTEIDVAYKKGEPWKKVFGPVFIYLNSASSDDDFHKTLWNDAKRQLSEEIEMWPYYFTRSEDFPHAEQRGEVNGQLLLSEEIEMWPYYFTRSEDFPHAEQRGEVNGQLLVRDRYMDKKLMQAKSASVGLAAPGNAGSWQTEGKGYQFWTQTDDNGCFNIKNVRPGEYNLYAWVYGFIGDYKLERNLTIQPGDKINLGTLVCDPPRNGPTLWEIGIPDRRAAEFFMPEPYPKLVNSVFKNKADKFRAYGLWNSYTDIYPHSDLVYTVGVSNYSRDWFFAHVPRNTSNSSTGPTTWQIKYNLKDVNRTGCYTLQLALAAASYTEVQVRFNKPDAILPDFTTRRIGYDNAVTRHGIHGLYRLYSITVPGDRLQTGDNTIFLTQTRAECSFNSVMYD